MSRAIISILFVLGISLVARTGPISKSDEPILKFGTWQRHFPEMGMVTTGVLTAGKEVYLLMPPANWTMLPGDALTVRFKNPRRGTISIRLLSSTESKSSVSAVDGLRSEAQRQVPGAQIVRETICHTDSQSGPAFDFKSCDDRGTEIITRIAYVQVGARCFEFNFQAPSEEFAAELSTFAGVLTSFQVAP